MKKKLVGLILLSSLVGASIAGCNGNTVNEATTVATSDTVEDSSDEQSTADNAESDISSEAEDSVRDIKLTLDLSSGSLSENQMITLNNSQELNIIDDKYRSTYEVFVYSFCDSDGDGVGDLQGLISRLDYINDGDDTTDSDLGFNEIWLMPICPSTTYHKYDVTDYMDIDPEYGTLADFEQLVEECHDRGVNVIVDMVMNHTSSQHPWFTEACDYLKNLPDGEEPSVEDCKYYGYYNFAKEAQTGYEQLSGTDWYYEARFWSEMPDLNLENEDVRNEFQDIAQFWLDEGVDGFRMDAVTSYTTNDVATSTTELGWFVDTVKSIDSDAYIVGEGWTDLNSIADYYDSGIDSMFNFDYSGSEGKIAKMARGKMSAIKFAQSLVDIQELFGSHNSEYIDAPFYTNHDMARSAGYYTGMEAQDRTKLAGALNLLMSGNAFVYYGEELGMKGSGDDENKRAPMQWSSDSSVAGMCAGPENMDDIKMSYGSLEDQASDSYSIYNYYKEAVRLRNMFPAIARGEVSLLDDLATEEVIAIKKTIDTEKFEGIDESDKEIYILVNTAEEERTLTLSGTECDGCNLSGVLITSENEVIADGAEIILPAFSVAILTK